jgi:hypothetical protein
MKNPTSAVAVVVNEKEVKTRKAFTGAKRLS